jgi:hypothetical protein
MLGEGSAAILDDAQQAFEYSFIFSGFINE